MNLPDPARQWQLVIPAPCDWITANMLLGRWSRWDRAKLTRLWREAACTVARAERLPTGLAKVRIDAVFRVFGRSPVRDRDNLRPTVKAAIDGLGPARQSVRKGKTYRFPGYGLIPDDSDRHLQGTDIVIERWPARPNSRRVGELVLLIKEIPS